MFKRIVVLTIVISCLALFSTAHACTDFQVKAKDGSIIIGRSMEFAMGMGVRIAICNQF
jgi:penicillin V acylase-like amidase (Ntn superfamily)